MLVAIFMTRSCIVFSCKNWLQLYVPRFESKDRSSILDRRTGLCTKLDSFHDLFFNHYGNMGDIPSDMRSEFPIVNYIHKVLTSFECYIYVSLKLSDLKTFLDSYMLKFEFVRSISCKYPWQSPPSKSHSGTLHCSSHFLFPIRQFAQCFAQYTV